MSTNTRIPHDTEVKGIGPRGLIAMVILALILFTVAVSRGAAAQTPDGAARLRSDALAKVVASETPSPGDRVRMWANTTMQGRPASPDASWSVPVQTHVHENGTLYQGLTVMSTVTGTVPISGLGMNRTYSVSVKGLHTLRVRLDNLTTTDYENYYDFGDLPEGDSNNDNTINALDASILASAFWTKKGEAGFVAGADFNEDGVIDARDASLMATNYWQTGDLLPAP